MSNLRREKTRQKFGFDSEKKISKKKKVEEVARVERSKREDRRQEIEQNMLYKTLIKGALGFDLADGLLGLLEVGGDILSALLSLLYVGLSLFVVRSFRLTAAVFCVALADLALGLIPVAGTLLDIVFCGNYINRTMIKGFVEGDEQSKKRVNQISLVLVGVLLLGVAIWALFFFVVGKGASHLFPQ